MKNDKLKKILGTDENFLSFLNKEAQSDGYRHMKRKAGKDFHPGADTLFGYVLEKLNSEERHRVREHISYCEACVGKVLTIRMTEGG